MRGRPRVCRRAWAAVAAGAFFLATAWLMDNGGLATAQTPAATASATVATTPSPSPTSTATSTAVTSVTTAPTLSSGSCALSVSDQTIGGSGATVTVARARIPERGYVVIQEYDESSGFGPVLGSTPLAAGEEAVDIRVLLNRHLVAGERLWALLYAETTGDDSFEPPFVGTFDEPLITSACANPAFVNAALGGGYAMFPFTILAGSVTPGAPATGAGTSRRAASGWESLALIGVGAASLLAGAGVVAGRRRQ